MSSTDAAYTSVPAVEGENPMDKSTLDNTEANKGKGIVPVKVTPSAAKKIQPVSRYSMRKQHWGPTSASLKNSSRFIGIWQLILIVLFWAYGRVPVMTDADPGTITQGYQYYTGVQIMMFIGFGYLMTFMKDFGISAVGFTMLITALGIQWYVFCESFFHQIFHGQADSSWHHVDFTIYSLLNALFGISAVLISFGAVIGKAKPFQLMVMAFIELIVHALNYEWILVGGMKTADIGGTYADHMFGAYFGLAVSYVLARPVIQSDPAMGYVSDLFSFIGTLFLWIYWPSFVGGAAVANSLDQERAIVNTILALSASTLTTFALSFIISEENVFRPVDIQNATLSGGVAIGCIANFDLNPVNAIFVGCAAGYISTLGFNRITPWLLSSIGLHDTCGVHNLHGMPSIVGGIASVILAAYKQTGGRNHDADIFLTHHGDQAWRQFVSILLVMTCAIVCGLITGNIMNWVDPVVDMRENDDSHYWETAPDYIFHASEFFAPYLSKKQRRQVKEKLRKKGSKLHQGIQFLDISSHSGSRHGSEEKV